MYEIKPKPNEVLVNLLQELVDQAKTGELQGIAFATTYSDAGTGNGFHTDRPVPILGELSVLETEIKEYFELLRKSIDGY